MKIKWQINNMYTNANFANNGVAQVQVYLFDDTESAKSNYLRFV